MNIRSQSNGARLKTVTFVNVTDETDDEIREAAYAETGESRESTFGTDIIRYALEEGTVKVQIWID